MLALFSGPVSREDLDSALESIGKAYGAALGLKYLSLLANAMGNQLPILAHHAFGSGVGLAGVNSNLKMLLTTYTGLIDRESTAQLNRLPAFLRQRFHATVGDTSNAGLAERLHQWSATLHALAADDLRAAGPYHTANPNIRPPLSCPELEALKNLVDLQSNKTLGLRWSDHHTSVLHAEAARQLSEIGTLMADLGNRAQATAQQLAQLAAAEAQLRAEEQARQAAAEAQRRAEDQVREDKAAIYSASSIRMPASIVVVRPAAFGLNGLLPVIDAAGVALEAAVRGSIAAVAGAVSTTAPGLLAGISLLVYSPKLGNSELPPDFVVVLPLSDLDPDFADQPSRQIDDGDRATAFTQSNLPVRLTTATIESNKTSVVAIKTGEHVPASVRVVAATPTPSGSSYVVATPDIPSRTLLWTPAVTPSDNSTAFPGASSLPTYYEGPVAEPVSARLDVLPVSSVRSFDDLIVWFPADSGLPPVYVMYADRRNEPGVASGHGQPVSDNWLVAASSDGAPVPSRIAAQLTGKAFGSFKDFREAFWKAVASDPGLMSQFKKANLSRMANGRASLAPTSSHVGKRRGFELHHRQAIANGGAVYDIDNIKILTPKKHVETHKGKTL